LWNEGGALRGTMQLEPGDVTNLPIGRFVEVECEALSWWNEWDNGWHSFGCAVGPLVLPVISKDRLGTRDDKRLIEGRRVSGRLRAFDAKRNEHGEVEFRWDREVIDDPIMTRGYLQVTDEIERWTKWIVAASLIAGCVAALVLLCVWYIWPSWRRDQFPELTRHRAL
jgi:hypothetical protein